MGCKCCNYEFYSVAHSVLGSVQVIVLPFHDPVIVAEDFATVDILSKGRLLFGIGRGYQVEEFYNWGIDPEESTDRFREATEALRAEIGHSGQEPQPSPL